MVKKDIERAINHVLDNSNRYLTQSQISQKTGIDIIKVVKTLDKFERKGLVVSR